MDYLEIGGWDGRPVGGADYGGVAVWLEAF